MPALVGSSDWHGGSIADPGEALSLHPSLVLLQQKIAGLHVGRKTALEWYGMRQYVSQQAPLHLYGWATARLMIQIAPLVFADNVFALKGGTAINLFVRRD